MTTEQLKIGVVLKTATGSTNMYKISLKCIIVDSLILEYTFFFC